MFGLDYWHLWTILGVLLIIGEILISGFVLAFFSVGAIITAVAAFFGAGVDIQLFVFAVSSLALTLVCRPLFKKITSKRTPTNVDALAGQIGVVEETIGSDSSSGRVKLAGDNWKATAKDNSTIEVGARVKVLEVRSTTIIVERAEKSD